MLFKTFLIGLFYPVPQKSFTPLAFSYENAIIRLQLLPIKIL